MMGLLTSTAAVALLAQQASAFSAAQCEDLDFLGTYGGCAAYGLKGWCANGAVGPNWKHKWGSVTPGAAKACCACGGGSKGTMGRGGLFVPSEAPGVAEADAAAAAGAGALLTSDLGGDSWCCTNCNCQDRTNDEEACTGAQSQTTCNGNGNGNGGVTGDLLRVAADVLKQPAGELYFYAIDRSTETGPPANNAPRCGEVNAAPFMPEAMFDRSKPRNVAALVAYAAATEKLHKIPELGRSPLSVKLGRCRDVNANWRVHPNAKYTSCEASMQGVVWTPGGLMGPVCRERCRCNFLGSLGPVPGLPPCRDQTDDPSASNFCSLCGPSTACRGCPANTVTVTLCSPVGGR